MTASKGYACISQRPTSQRTTLSFLGESKNANFPKDIHEDSLMGRILFGCDRHRVAMLVGGTSILRDIKPKLGAAAIIDFLAGVSPLMHDFWRREDPNQRMNDMINFTKNVAWKNLGPPA